jgi:diketogulonate reductase-like aldo/keto reductase
MHFQTYSRAIARERIADTFYMQKTSDRAIIDAVAVIAKAPISRAQVALAWLRRNPVVVAPFVGATKPSHLDDAVASLAIELTGDEVTSLEATLYAAQRLSGGLRRRRARPHLGQNRHQGRQSVTGRKRELIPCTLSRRKPQYSEVPFGSCRL